MMLAVTALALSLWTLGCPSSDDGTGNAGGDVAGADDTVGADGTAQQDGTATGTDSAGGDDTTGGEDGAGGDDVTGPDTIGGEDATNPDTSDDTGPPPDASGCAALSEGECQNANGCVAIQSTPVAQACDSSATKTPTFAGCGPVGECSDSEVCAMNPTTGDKAIFTSSCTPDGWTKLTVPAGGTALDACCAAPSDWAACEGDKDCVVLEMGCCDHCNGGWLMSVNGAYSEQAQDLFKQEDCGLIACTELACSPVLPACQGGTCGWTEINNVDCDGLDPDTCAATEGCEAVWGEAAGVCPDPPLGGGEPLWLGCASAAFGCGDGVVCAQNLETGEKVQALSTCLPSGYTSAPTGVCCNPPEAPPGWDSCSTADDCVTIEMGCCDHCNGGWLMSVNAAYEDDAITMYQEQSCDGVACTKKACAPVTTTCVDETCGWESGFPPPACSGLDEESCLANAACSPIYGGPVDEYCAGNFDNWPTVYAGCQDAGLGCDDAITCGSNPDGKQLVFPDTCVPAGWKYEIGDCCATEDPCAAFTEDECLNASACVPLYGAPAEEICAGNDDLWASVFAGCAFLDLGCAEVETCATTPSGVPWYFPNSCIPEGWTFLLGDCCEAAATCPEGGTAAPMGTVCVRGEIDEAGEVVSAGAPAMIQVTPAGCYSSSCTIIYSSGCSIATSLEDPFQHSVSAEICLGPTGDLICTADCNGGGFTTCDGPGLEAGTHTFTLGDLSVTVEVPSTLPFGGTCAGALFE